MTHLYLIRHALADGLKDGFIGTLPPNSGLSMLGVTQAESLRDRLIKTGEIRADVLISSPLRRAKETAEIIAPALDLAVTVDDGVQEINLGECDGLTWEEIGERFGHFELEQEPFHRLGLTGESMATFAMRTCEAIDRLTRQYEGKSLVIVCHGGVISITFSYFLGLPVLQYQSPPNLIRLGSCQNTSITHWRKGQQGWILLRFNDYAHLDEYFKRDYPS